MQGDCKKYLGNASYFSKKTEEIQYYTSLFIVFRYTKDALQDFTNALPFYTIFFLFFIVVFSHAETKWLGVCFTSFFVVAFRC